MVNTIVLGNNRFHHPTTRSPNHKFNSTKQPQFLCTPISKFPKLPHLDFSPNTIYLVYCERPPEISFSSFCNSMKKEIFSFEKKLHENSGAGKAAISKSIHVLLPQCYFNHPLGFINDIPISQTLDIEIKIYHLQQALLTRKISSTILPTNNTYNCLETGQILTQMCIAVDDRINSLTTDVHTC